MVVPLCQDDGIPGHHILRPPQEEPPGVVPACLPPLRNHVFLVAVPQVHPQRAGGHRGPHQLPGARGHVLLLHDRGHGTSLPKVHLVEEVYDRHSAGETNFMISCLVVTPTSIIYLVNKAPSLLAVLRCTDTDFMDTCDICSHYFIFVITLLKRGLLWWKYKCRQFIIS